MNYIYLNTGIIVEPKLSVTWLDGTAVTSMDWGFTLNGTEYMYSEPVNVTNIGNVDITLSIGYQNPSLSILSITVSWNYTSATLTPNESAILELYQNVTATGPYSYDTVITAVA